MTQDYNEKLRKDYEDIKRRVETGMLPLVDRIPAIDKAVSGYVLAQDAEFERKRRKAIEEGRSPNSVPIQYRDHRMLQRFADLLMYEYLTWNHHDKMNIVENPILSDSQMRYRHRKETTLADVYTGKNDDTIGRKKDGKSGNKRIYDYMTPERDMALVPTSYLDLYNALDNAGLTDRQRQAIELVYFQGLTQADAGAEMGVSQQAVDIYLRNSYDKLRLFND